MLPCLTEITKMMTFIKIGELMVWTGTHGLLQLADSNGNLVMPLYFVGWGFNNLLIFHSFHSHLQVDIYLDDEGNQKVPVPK